MKWMSLIKQKYTVFACCFLLNLLFVLWFSMDCPRLNVDDFKDGRREALSVDLVFCLRQQLLYARVHMGVQW